LIVPKVLKDSAKMLKETQRDKLSIFDKIMYLAINPLTKMIT